MVAGPVLRGRESGGGLRPPDVALRRAADRPVRVGGNPGRMLGGGRGLRSAAGGGVAGVVVLCHLRAGAGGVFQSPGTGNDDGHQQLVHPAQADGAGLVRGRSGRGTGPAASCRSHVHRRSGLAFGVGVAGRVHRGDGGAASVAADGAQTGGHGPGARPGPGRETGTGISRRPDNAPACPALNLEGYGLHRSRGDPHSGLLDTGLLLNGGVHGAGGREPAPDGPLRRRRGVPRTGGAGGHGLRAWARYRAGWCGRGWAGGCRCG